MSDGRPPARERWAGDVLRQVWFVVVVLALAVPAGWAWQHWSPHTRAYVIDNGVVIPEETESQIAADGRFVVVAVTVGLLAAIVLWTWRARRGPITAIGLVVGMSGACALADLIGRLTSGGRTDGAVNSVITLPVQVHARGMLVLGPGVALVLYLVLVLFASRDDLGRPEWRRGPADQAEALDDLDDGRSGTPWQLGDLDVVPTPRAEPKPSWTDKPMGAGPDASAER
jgi:hypothetical protein